MGLGLVGYLVAHAGLEQKLPAIFKFSIELALEAKQDVALGAPMVGQRTPAYIPPSARECSRTVGCANKRFR